MYDQAPSIKDGKFESYYEKVDDPKKITKLYLNSKKITSLPDTIGEKLDTLNFHKASYNVALSDKEAEYLKNIIDEHFRKKKEKK